MLPQDKKHPIVLPRNTHLNLILLGHSAPKWDICQTSRPPPLPVPPMPPNLQQAILLLIKMKLNKTGVTIVYT
jgi:hypothetical protein